MTCNIAQPGGYNGQVGRNLRLEPLFGANSRSVDGPLRNEEVKADKTQRAVGLGVGGALLAVGGGLGAFAKLGNLAPWAKLMLGATAGVTALTGGYLAATGVAGWKNLNAKLTCPPKDDHQSPDKGGPAPVPHPGGGNKPGPVDPTTPTDPAPSKPRGSHTVVKGDVLTDIALCNDVSVEDLYTYNKDTIGDNGNRIFPGMKLFIPPADYHGPGAKFDPTAPRSLPQNQCVPVPDSALEPC